MSRHTRGFAVAVALVLIWEASGYSQGGPLNTTRIISNETGFTTDITADGRFAIVNTQAYGRSTEQNPSQLQVRDLRTNATTTISTGRSPFGRPAAVFSADARRVAYTWTESTPPGAPQPVLRTVMMVVDADEGATAHVLVPPDGSGTVPHAWSNDGKSILALVHGPGANIADPTSLAWVSVPDGAIRTIKTLEPWRSGATLARPRLSPDGRWIAYSAIARQGSSESDVYVVDVSGKNERAVATLPGSNTTPVWTPDSTHLVFVNGQAGRRDLMVVAVQADTRSPQPARLKADFPGEPIRISASGDLFYLQAENLGVHEIIAEPQSTGARVEQTFPGAAGTWFRGNTLAFVRPAPLGSDLVVRSLATGQERVFTHPGIGPVPPRWFNDGSGVMVYIRPTGDAGRPGGAFYRVNLTTGDFVRVLAKDTAEHERSMVTTLSPDNRTLYLAARTNGQASWTSIVAVNLATGVERSIMSFPASRQADSPGIAINPDGTTLAIHAEDGRIMTVSVDGRELREVYRPAKGGGWPEVMRWTPDGQAIVFVIGGSSADTAWQLMKISAAGGQPEFAGLDSSRLESSVPVPRLELGSVISMDLSPDSSRIAFSSRAVPYFDVWSLGNVTTALRR